MVCAQEETLAIHLRAEVLQCLYHSQELPTHDAVAAIRMAQGMAGMLATALSPSSPSCDGTVPTPTLMASGSTIILWARLSYTRTGVLVRAVLSRSRQNAQNVPIVAHFSPGPRSSASAGQFRASTVVAGGKLGRRHLLALVVPG